MFQDVAFWGYDILVQYAQHLCLLYSYFWIISRCLNLCADDSEDCSIFIGRVNKKHNRDEIGRLSVLVKVCLKRSLGQSGGGGMGNGVPE